MEEKKNVWKTSKGSKILVISNTIFLAICVIMTILGFATNKPAIRVGLFLSLDLLFIVASIVNYMEFKAKKDMESAGSIE